MITTQLTCQGRLGALRTPNHRNGGPSQVQRMVQHDPRGLGWRRVLGRPTQAIAVQGFARVNVMRTYPDPLVASNAAGRPLSRFGALSHTVSVSPSRA
jgi:hypothetical protein